MKKKDVDHQMKQDLLTFSASVQIIMVMWMQLVETCFRQHAYYQNLHVTNIQPCMYSACRYILFNNIMLVHVYKCILFVMPRRLNNFIKTDISTSRE